MEKGKIIFINGVSSTGKTTLSKTLQQCLTVSVKSPAHSIVEFEMG